MQALLIEAVREGWEPSDCVVHRCAAETISVAWYGVTVTPKAMEM